MVVPRRKKNEERTKKRDIEEEKNARKLSDGKEREKKIYLVVCGNLFKKIVKKLYLRRM